MGALGSWPAPRHGLAALAAALGGAAFAADPPIEQIVGGIEAIVFVCTPIEPKSAKTGTELLQKTSAERKLDLAAVRKTEGYKAIYNSEVNRLLALPARERSAACRNAW
jgi:hypothetical protein